MKKKRNLEKIQMRKTNLDAGRQKPGMILYQM